MDRGTTKILLVDDEKDHIALIRLAFEGASFKAKLTVAHSLAEAKQVLQRAPPDMVICDYRLPDGTGLDLLSCDEKQPTLPVVILTGKGDEKLAVAALKAGAMDYVVKTDEAFADLPHIVERSMAQWQQIAAIRKAEESLHRAESIVSVSSDMLGMLDRNYAYLVVNPAYAQAIGKDVGELVGHSVPEVLGEAFFRDVIKPHADLCLSGEQINYQAWFEFPTSGRRYMDVNYFPYAGADGEIAGFIVNKRDITERRQAEDERIRIEAMANQASDMLFLCDDQEVVLYTNHVAERMTGLKPKEIIGKSLSHLFDAGCRGLVVDSYRAAMKGEPRSFELTFKATGIHCEFRIQPYRVTKGIAGVLGSVRDITERKRYEWQIKESEGRYRALFQLNPLMCFNLDVEGTITAVNEQGASQLGYTVDELNGQPVSVLFPDELHEKVHKQLQVCLREPGRVFSWQISKVRKDGSGLWVNETASAIPAASGEQQPSVLIMCEDITERKRDRERLESSEAHYRALFESVSDYALLLELQPSGPSLIVDANEAAFVKHGYTREEMIGQPINIVDKETPEASREAIKRSLEAGELVLFETRHTRKDGSTFDVEVVVRKVRFGSHYQVYSVERDITERKAAQAKVEEHVRELERFQKATVDREFRIKELRDEIARLKARLGEVGDGAG